MPSNWIRPLTAAPCVRRLPVWASWVTRWTSRRSNGAARPNCNLRNYKQRLYGVVFTHPPGFLPRYGEGLCFLEVFIMSFIACDTPSQTIGNTCSALDEAAWRAICERSEERRVGKGCGSTCRCRLSASH